MFLQPGLLHLPVGGVDTARLQPDQIGGVRLQAGPDRWRPASAGPRQVRLKADATGDSTIIRQPADHAHAVSANAPHAFDDLAQERAGRDRADCAAVSFRCGAQSPGGARGARHRRIVSGGQHPDPPPQPVGAGRRSALRGQSSRAGRAGGVRDARAAGSTGRLAADPDGRDHRTAQVERSRPDKPWHLSKRNTDSGSNAATSSNPLSTSSASLTHPAPVRARSRVRSTAGATSSLPPRTSSPASGSGPGAS